MKKVSDSGCDTKGEFVFRGLGPSRQLWILMLLLLLGCQSAEIEAVTGKPYVTDGDTVKISGERVRLEGIDAPERKQRCKNATGNSYGCGFTATTALKRKIGHSSITCEGSERDRYGRLLGICYLGELDLNNWMVRNGYALAYRKYSQKYVSAEKEAREAGRGLWAGEFVPPWRWRRGERIMSRPYDEKEGFEYEKGIRSELASKPYYEKDGHIKLILQDPFQFKRPKDRCESEMCRALLSLINNASKSIDFAIYGARNQAELFNAIVRAKKRGVTVRGYVDKDKNNENYYASTGKWIKDIGNVRDDFRRESRCAKRFQGQKYTCKRPEGFQGPVQCLAYDVGNEYLVTAQASREPIISNNMIMHNKFFVVDGLHVWTGSANISDSGTGGYNANAVVLIKSAGIASVYTEEFEKLWNRSGYECEKARNGVERFKLNNSEVTTWFSPQDRTSRYGIKSLISRAEKKINVAVFFLTSKYLVADLIAAHHRGVRVRVIIDATAAKNGYSKHELLREAGIPVKVENWGGKMHMKSASVDGKFLVMGSMNWTAAGEYSNDENTLLIKSNRLASKFDGYYRKIWNGIPKRWSKKNARPDPESRDSQTACSDGVDNDFDKLADAGDPGCSKNPSVMLSLPPYKLLSKDNRRDILKRYRLIKSQRCHSSYPDWFVCIPEKSKYYKTDCDDIPYRNFTVRGQDPLGLARNQNGVGCRN